jgi:hypothetical protein
MDRRLAHGLAHGEAVARQRVDLRDQDHRIAQHHAEQRQRAQHRHEAERYAEQRHDQRHADQRERSGRQHHEHPLDVLELQHQQDHDHHHRGRHCGHGGALVDAALLLRAAVHQRRASGKVPAQRLDLGFEALGEVGGLLALDVGGDGDRRLPVAPVKQRGLAARGDPAQLRQGDRAALRGDRQVGDAAEVGALGRVEAHDDIEGQIAVAVGGDAGPGDRGLQGLLHRLGGEAEGTHLVLVEIDADRLERFAEIAVHVARMAVRADDRFQLLRKGASASRSGPARRYCTGWPAKARSPAC